MAKNYDLREMTRADLEDEVMLLRAKVKVMQDNSAGYAALLTAEQKNRAAAERRADGWKALYYQCLQFGLDKEEASFVD